MRDPVEALRYSGIEISFRVTKDGQREYRVPGGNWRSAHDLAVMVVPGFPLTREDGSKALDEM